MTDGQVLAAIVGVLLVGLAGVALAVGLLVWLVKRPNAQQPPSLRASSQPIEPAPKDFTNSVGMGFVWIAPGSFQMGSLDEDLPRSKPAHRVTLTKGYYLQTTQVTQSQWQAVMGNNPSSFKGPDRPVDCVSWEDTQEFLRRLNALERTSRYRLPTEAEWEYACRAGGQEPDVAPNLDELGWWLGNSGVGAGTHPVKLKKANAWGLYDMRGNVLEWVADWYGPYAPGNQIDPMGPGSGTYRTANIRTFELRVMRGGSWGDDNPGRLGCSVRQHNVPTQRSSEWGFRCACSR